MVKEKRKGEAWFYARIGKKVRVDNGGKLEETRVESIVHAEYLCDLQGDGFGFSDV